MFDYYGATLTYAIQYIPIFMLHTYDHIPAEELGPIISNVMLFLYFDIFLIKKNT